MVCAKSLQSCPTLCDPMDCRPPSSSLHGILQARILEWVAMPFSRDLPDPKIRPTYPVAHAVLCGHFNHSSFARQLRKHLYEKPKDWKPNACLWQHLLTL